MGCISSAAASPTSLTAGSDASDRELRAATADMLHTLADRLATLAGSDGWILLAGIPEVVSDAMSAMPIRLERRVRRLEHLDIHASRRRRNPGHARPAASTISRA